MVRSRCDNTDDRKRQVTSKLPPSDGRVPVETNHRERICRTAFPVLCRAALRGVNAGEGNGQGWAIDPLARRPRFGAPQARTTR